MGPLTETLKEGIKQYGLEDTLFFHGPMPAKQAGPYFKGADALYVSLTNE